MSLYRSRAGSQTALWVLIGTNVALFLASQAIPVLVDNYALVPAEVLSHPWTVLTAMFLHGSWAHITGNMLTLYFFGSSLIQLQGENRFLGIYILGGVAGNLLYVLIGQQYVGAIGASGAIFALGGALIALIPKQKVTVLLIPVPLPLWAAVAGGFLLFSLWPGVAWEAHLGGILTGLVIGLLFRRRSSSRL